jgi:hypothetical protein
MAPADTTERSKTNSVASIQYFVNPEVLLKQLQVPGQNTGGRPRKRLQQAPDE